MNTKDRLVRVAFGVCLVVIGCMAYYLWNLNQKVDQLQAQTIPGAGLIMPQQPEPLAEDWDPWSNPWDPSGQFSQMHKRMDDMMDSMLPGHSIFSNRGFGLSSLSPQVTMEETDEGYKIVVTVPEGQEVELSTELREGVLKISGKVKNTVQNSAGGLLGRSLSTSQFSQSMTLSAPVDESAMTIDETEKEVVVRIPKRSA